jgi:hypothetical protein
MDYSQFRYDPYMRRRGRYLSGMEGLVRTDRVVVYIRQQLRRLVEQVQQRNTKTIGDTYYSIVGLVRRSGDLLMMAGEAQLAESIGGLAGLSTRTSRRDALAAMSQTLNSLESYQVTEESSIAIDDNGGKAVQVSAKELTDDRAVFIIMPFSADFTDVWKGGIQKAAQAESFKPIRVDMINASTDITDDIVSSIERCHLAIVDVTNNNPNVMFELGYAIAKSKRNIIISQSADFLPFDIRNIRTIVYSNPWSGIEELKSRLQEFLKDSAHSKNSKRKTRNSKSV